MHSLNSNNNQKQTKTNKYQNGNFDKSQKREVINKKTNNSNNQYQKDNKKGKKNIEFRNKIDIEEFNEPENPNIKTANLTTKNNPVITEIEYEKVTNKDIVIDENDNYNVYFMKPVFKSKTITVSKKQKPSFKINSKNKQKILQNIDLNDDDDDQNPYNTNEYNDSEPQFEKNSEIMPLETNNNEKQFKAHLVQRLKSYKIKQAENNKIPLNIASKIRREESIRYSLKHLLAKQSQAIDAKKELIYYKGYFRFWKKKCKMVDELKFKKRFKKDRNIRITTVIYKAEKPHRSKNVKQKVRPEIIQEQKEIEKFRQNLIINLEQRKKERLSSISNDKAKYNSKTLNDLNYEKYNINKNIYNSISNKGNSNINNKFNKNNFNNFYDTYNNQNKYSEHKNDLESNKKEVKIVNNKNNEKKEKKQEFENKKNIFIQKDNLNESKKSNNTKSKNEERKINEQKNIQINNKKKRSTRKN